LAVTKALVDEGAFVVAGSRSTDNLDGLDRIRLDGVLGTSDQEFEWAMQMNFFTGLCATRAKPRS
jgi:hypothetical protein